MVIVYTIIDSIGICEVTFSSFICATEPKWHLALISSWLVRVWCVSGLCCGGPSWGTEHGKAGRWQDRILQSQPLSFASSHNTWVFLIIYLFKGEHSCAFWWTDRPLKWRVFPQLPHRGKCLFYFSLKNLQIAIKFWNQLYCMLML